MQLHIHKDGQTFGPYSEDEVLGFIKQGSFFPTDSACIVGDDKWARIDQIISIAPPASTPKPDKGRVMAILSIIFGLPCCWGLHLPFGIAAIVFASQVDGKYAAGDFTGAESSAKWARILGWVAMGLVILSAIFNLIWFVVFGDSVIDTLF